MKLFAGIRNALLPSLVFWGLLIWAVAANAQGNVQQSGTITTGQAAYWVSNGIIGSSGNSNDSLITSLGVTNSTGAGFCVNSGRAAAAGRQRLCFYTPLASAAQISLQNYGTATPQDLQFVINGTTVTIPTGGGTFLTGTGTFTVGHLLRWNSASGIVEDAGLSLASGTQYGVPIYSATSAITSTAALTNGQIIVGQTGGNPTPRTLSGDVASVSASGAVTLQSVNGVTYPASFSANGVLYAATSTSVTSVATSNIGYCLLSNGSSSPPSFAACASGSGSAGGSNTQIQFNNSTALAGSANLTWISPALTIGLSASTNGQLAMASSGGGTVTVMAQSAVNTTYNFNLPNSAGSSGQPLISGGGGTSIMTFGTLGIFGGGTNCNAASGTCLDNITSFSSTGYINRTGSGSYSFSAQIPVSSGGTGLASGTSGGVLCYTASGTLASSATLTNHGVIVGGGAGACPVALTAGTNGQILVGQTSADPVFTTLSGDISAVSAGGAVTIASSAVTNAKLANSAAYTLKGNFTGSSAAPQDSTVGSLTQKASPGANDLLLLQDQAAAGALKYATVSSIASAGAVGDVNGLTGSVTIAAGTGISVATTSSIAITNTGVVTVKQQTFCPSGCTTTIAGGGSGTYTPSTGMLYADIYCVGGGGGGGGAGSTAGSTFGGGGGGAGSVSVKRVSAADIGASKAVGIGTGGTAGTAGVNAGGGGGDTSVSTLCVGKGASGGGGSTANTVTGGLGGVPGTGDITGAGQSGFNGISTGSIAVLPGISGDGGSTPFGGGGRGVQSATSTAGNACAGFGSGGSGGATFNGAGTAAGGAGCPGFVRVVEFNSQ